jgi:SMI1-KNR4 cell-wall
VARFERIKRGFWNPDSTYGVQPPLTDEAIAGAESVVGVRLPEALVELLKVQNGGSVSPEFDAFPTTEPTSWADDHVPFADVMGIGEREVTLPLLGREAFSLLDTPYLAEEWGLPSPVVLLSGDGHYWVALDYRECGFQDEPTVVWFDTELRTELTLANDFQSFVEGLRAGDSFDIAGPE